MAGSKKDVSLSRREFAQVVVLATAGAPLAVHGDTRNNSNPGTQEAAVQPLRAAGEAQFQTILAKYGKRLSDEQKADIKRLIAQAQKASDTLRSFPLENSDEPAMIFHVYRKTM